VRFRALADGDPTVRLDRVMGRDRENQPVALNDVPVGQPLVLPAESRLLPAAPVPFTTRTTISYALAAETQVEVAVFGIEGRRVRTLARGLQPAGVHQVGWDGTDDRGRTVAAGVYYAHLVLPSGRFSQTLVRLAR
jgi:hypothetical protein